MHVPVENRPCGINEWPRDYMYRQLLLLFFFMQFDQNIKKNSRMNTHNTCKTNVMFKPLFAHFRISR